MERRFTSNSQGGNAAVRTANRLGKQFIEGVAAVYYDGTRGSEYQLAPGIMERLMPGAFDKALRDREDVRGLFNHNPSLILGRTTSGTLTLSVDSKGLRYRIDPPETRADVLESVERGDITGSSFGFVVYDETWRRDGKYEVRELRSVGLTDVSVVTYPAYTATSVDLSAARSAFREREAINRRFRFLQLQQQQG